MEQSCISNQKLIKVDSQKLSKLNYLLQNSKLSKNLSNQNHSDRSTNHNLLSSMDLSKDLSLYLSIIEKPINLLFSIDQFLFEFSKKTYQQKKTGEFFQQLKERKKLCLFYGHLSRQQIVNLFDKAKKNKGDFSKNVFSLLERRLDVVLYRSGITKTIAEARQLIKHKKILVNQNFVNVPSYLLNPGEIISIAPKTADNLSHQLMNSKITRVSKNHPRIFGNFYSKLKTIFLKAPVENILASPTYQKFHSKFFCNFFIRLLCTQIKLRCFLDLVKDASISNTNQNLLCFMDSEKDLSFSVNKGKTVLTKIKWKSFFKREAVQKTMFFVKGNRKFMSSQKTNLMERLDYPQALTKINNFKRFSLRGQQEENLYANQGSLKKKPLFWSQKTKFFRRHLLNSKKNHSIELKNKKTLELQKKSFSSIKKKNLALYRNSLLLFLKCLNNYHKFTNLFSLNLKKYFSKKSLYKKGLLFSKKLNLRLIKPIHLEISFNLLNVIYLYSPQRLNFPFYINVDLIKRSLR